MLHNFKLIFYLVYFDLPMDCKISPQNALMLDKICQTIKSQYLLIDITDKLRIQMVSDSKNVICNISFTSSFFLTSSLQNIVFRINKPRFSFSKMLNLKIESVPNFLIFIYEFDDYIYRHKYVIFNESVVDIPFNINKSDFIDPHLFYQVICQTSGSAKIEFDDQFGIVSNENISLKFQCPGFTGISFKFETEIFKKILSINDMFDSCLLNWEDDDSPVNINFYGTTMSVFLFIATQ
ncbi:DNA damage checkpoint protein DDC1 [Vairimorpha necatrix]|uniref:DNA damage checkpoint protein DDC1 n=1 Tax=Vairimorpha necatrix TaxID=6039 RepID=A0AAX4J9E8_9MICR